MYSLLLSLETPNDNQSVAYLSLNIQATSKGSDQTARMRRLVWACVGCTYHIVGKPKSRLKIFSIVFFFLENEAPYSMWININP